MMLESAPAENEHRRLTNREITFEEFAIPHR